MHLQLRPKGQLQIEVLLWWTLQSRQYQNSDITESAVRTHTLWADRHTAGDWMTFEVCAETVYVSMLICVFQDPPLPACLSMNLVHNHQLRCAEALRELRLTDNTRQSFDSYFADGLSPAQAMSLHESKLMVSILPVLVHLHYSLLAIGFQKLKML